MSVRLWDMTARIGLGVGIFATMQPWWDNGLRYGFFLTLASTILHIVTSHDVTGSESTREA